MASVVSRAVVVVELPPARGPGRGAPLPPVRVQALAVSSWTPRALALERVVVLTPRVLVLVLAASLSKRPPVPPFRAMQPLVLAQPLPAVELKPPALVLPLAFASTRALVLQRPF